MEDRLAELRGGVTAQPITPETATEDMMPEFNKKTKSIQFYLKKIRDNNREITRLKEKHARATLSDDEKTISEELDHLINENNKYCQSVKADLEALDADVAKSKQKEPDEPETRIKDINCRALQDRFFNILQEAQKVQINYKNAVKGKIARHARIIDPTLTEEQVETVCNDPEGANKLLANKMLGNGHMRVRNAVADIEDKYKDIIKLEKSVQIVHQMFIDMQMLVHAQGEMLDNIEINVGEAKNYVAKANVQLAKAKKSHQTYKKYKCCILITLMIIIAAVVLIPILVTKLK